MLGSIRPRSSSRVSHPEAGPSAAAKLAARRPSEKRGQTPARTGALPQANARAPSRAAPSNFSRVAGASGTAGSAGAAGSSSVPRTAATSLPAPSPLGGPALNGGASRAAAAVRSGPAAGVPGTGVVEKGAASSRAGGSSLGPRPADRRKSTAAIRAGMHVASSSNLGDCSNASSSPRSSKSDACQETGEEGLAQPPVGSPLLDAPERKELLFGRRAQQAPSFRSASSRTEAVEVTKLPAAAPKLVAPPGVEEDFEPYTWLSDAGIAFASSCFASAAASSTLGGKGRAIPKTVMFMDPAMAFWLTMQDDQKYLEEAKTEMKLQDLDLVLCPINDAHSASSADAGCHWSLLVCWGIGRGSSRASESREAKRSALTNFRFRYYDSLGGVFAEKGIEQATELASRLAGRSVQVEKGPSSQQTNFYDCGVYVLLFSEIIARAYADTRPRQGASQALTPLAWEDRLMAVTPEEVDACRAHFHDLARDASQR